MLLGGSSPTLNSECEQQSRFEEIIPHIKFKRSEFIVQRSIFFENFHCHLLDQTITSKRLGKLVEI